MENAAVQLENKRREDEEQLTSSLVPRDIAVERLAWFAVLVAGLGYFVDVFDMWLFANFRVASLTSLGLTPEQVTSVGAKLINWQQFGFLLGGFCWGVMGDKRGRASVMFGSIILYSIANLLNAFVTSVEQYAALRFVTGFGLAGEIGAGITLIAELLPKEKRGYGTTIVTALGVSGAIAAALAGKLLEWRTAFLVGGLGGLLLLFLRVLVHESGMFSKMSAASGLKRGSLKLLFSSRERVGRFLSCVLLGVPIYLTFGIIATFAPEIAFAIGIKEKISVPDVMLATSIGITVGDIGAGLLSQWMRSRKTPMLIFTVLGFLCALLIAFGAPSTGSAYALIAGAAGIFTGYWACLITTTAEQFGTNLRATVTTTVPNLVRASSIILTTLFVALKGSFEAQTSLLILTLGTYILTFTAFWFLKESFHRDLDYFERH